MTHLLAGLGLVLVLGGAGHALGVMHFYATLGVPEANRVLLDLWIAEAQLIGGGMYLAAARRRRLGPEWRAFGVCGAITIVAFGAPMLPVLASRAPLLFQLPVVVYLTLSGLIAVRIVRAREEQHDSPAPTF